MNERARPLLADIGFSGLEADAYLALLQEPGSTGYRVAQMVGKPVANTYKALDSLRVKGAVVADESAGTRTYSALAVHEYLDAMRRDLNLKQERLEEELKDLTATPLQSGIFKLENIDQVYERCRNLLNGAKNVILADAHAAPLQELRKELLAAARRGVTVMVKTYSPLVLPGCDVVAPATDLSHEFWNGDWLNLYVDWREYVQSFLKPNRAGVFEAVWSQNPYLAIHAFNGCMNELILTRVGLLIREKTPIDKIVEAIRRLSHRLQEESRLGEIIPEPWISAKGLVSLRKERERADKKPQPRPRARRRENESREGA